jgi:uncharacterized protein YihD (DUF1040 family)
MLTFAKISSLMFDFNLCSQVAIRHDFCALIMETYSNSRSSASSGNRSSPSTPSYLLSPSDLLAPACISRLFKLSQFYKAVPWATSIEGLYKPEMNTPLRRSLGLLDFMAGEVYQQARGLYLQRLKKKSVKTSGFETNLHLSTDQVVASKSKASKSSSNDVVQILEMLGVSVKDFTSLFSTEFHLLPPPEPIPTSENYQAEVTKLENTFYTLNTPKSIASSPVTSSSSGSLVVGGPVKAQCDLMTFPTQDEHCEILTRLRALVKQKLLQSATEKDVKGWVLELRVLAEMWNAFSASKNNMHGKAGTSSSGIPWSHPKKNSTDATVAAAASQSKHKYREAGNDNNEVQDGELLEDTSKHASNLAYWLENQRIEVHFAMDTTMTYYPNGVTSKDRIHFWSMYDGTAESTGISGGGTAGDALGVHGNMSNSGGKMKIFISLKHPAPLEGIWNCYLASLGK